MIESCCNLFGNYFVKEYIHMSKVTRSSAFLRYLFIFLFFAIPYFHISPYFLFKTNFITLYINHSEVRVPLDAHLQMANFFLNLIPMLIEMYIVFCLFKLFSYYQRNEIFLKSPLTYLRNIGMALMSKEIFNLVIQCIITYLATAQGGTVKKTMMCSITSQGVSNFLIGVIAVIITMVMYEAVKLKEDNESII
jgi:hypothetical protein